MVVVLLLRLAACCQPGWVPSPQTRLDKSVQIERNWRNRVVLTSLWCEAMAVVAPACVAQVTGLSNGSAWGFALYLTTSVAPLASRFVTRRHGLPMCQ